MKLFELGCIEKTLDYWFNSFMMKGEFGFAISSWINFGKFHSFLKLPVSLKFSNTLASSCSSYKSFHLSCIYRCIPSITPFFDFPSFSSIFLCLLSSSRLDYSRHRFMSSISLFKQTSDFVGLLSYACVLYLLISVLAFMISFLLFSLGIFIKNNF